MSYNLKNILVGTALSLILSVSAADKVAAQLPAAGGNEAPGAVSLDLDKTDNSQDVMPVLEDSPTENSANAPMITPSAPAAKLGNAPMDNNSNGGVDPLAPAMNNNPIAPSMDRNAPILPNHLLTAWISIYAPQFLADSKNISGAAMFNMKGKIYIGDSFKTPYFPGKRFGKRSAV